MSQEHAQERENAQAPINPYALIGGEDGVRRLVDRFYDIMDQDPAAATIRAMHTKDLTPMRERLTAFLTGWLGGPPVYFEKYPGACIMSAHQPYAIGAAERDEWMLCMTRALEESPLDAKVRGLVESAFLRVADSFVNR